MHSKNPLSGCGIGLGSFTNYIDQILSLIEHLPTLLTMVREYLGILPLTLIVLPDEFKLEFSGLGKPMKEPSRAKLGHFNFRAETKLKIF